MSDVEGTPEERYLALVEALSIDEAVGRYGSGKGTAALKVGGKMFAMLSKGRLVVKLPSKRVDALVSEAVGEKHDPGNGKLQKEWLAINPASVEQWLTLAEEARAYVVGRPK